MTLPRLGYLANSYPMTSTTFVRREIAAHETAGHPVTRFAIRPWDTALVEPLDIAEQRRTTYLLSGPLGGLAGLAGPVLREMLTNPAGFLRAAATAAGLARRAGEKRLYYAAWLMEAARLKQLARAAGIGHLHAHFSTNAATVALLARRLGGPAYSFTVHGPDELPGMAADGIREKVAHAAFVAAITGYCRDAVIAAAGADLAGKVEIVGCGVDLADFDPDSAPPAGDSTEIVCVGRLCPQKAQTTLVRAVAALKDRFPELRVTFIGDGDTRPEIEALIAEHGLQRQVTLAGWGSGAEVLAALRRSRALALPSHAEGLPIVIMEAMALARPVISTRVAGIPELLDGDCGWIVDPGDLPGLVAALEACISAPPAALAALGAEGRRRVEARHDQARNAARLRALIAAHHAAHHGGPDPAVTAP